MSRPATWKTSLDSLLQGAMEAVVLAMVALSPWAFASVAPQWESLLFQGVAVLLGLWGCRLLLHLEFPWCDCPVAMCLGGLLLLALVQMIPLDRGVLRAIAPSTADLYDGLLPGEGETLPGDVRADVPVRLTLSVFTYGTRRDFTRLLAVFLVYLAVRKNLASPAHFTRLAIVAVVVGAALSLLGIAQFFTSPPHTIYWTTPTEGMVFGPFICRNHFPFYANLCLGLGLGLLVGRLRHRPDASGFAELLREPRLLWLLAGMILILVGIVFSASRGGLLALVTAAAVFFAVRSRRSPSVLAPVLILVGVSVGLLSWFGTDRFTMRYTSLVDGGALGDERVSLFVRLLPTCARFPIWGTGSGSFDYIEPMSRSDGRDVGYHFQHAHNEYLEALIEGGVIRLALSLAAIVLVYRAARCALRGPIDLPTHGLVLGGVFAFTSFVVQSVVDFGAHVPAIALLATVLVAMLVAQGDGPRPEVTRLPALIALPLSLVGVLALAGCGVYLVTEGRREADVGVEFAAVRALRDSTKTADQARQLAHFETALKRSPHNPEAIFQLGQLRIRLYLGYRDLLRRADEPVLAAQAVALSSTPGLPGAASLVGAADVRERRIAAKLGPLDEILLRPGLVLLTRSRQMNPTRARTHLALAACRDRFQSPDAADVYLERAVRLDPADPEIAYEAGLLRLRAGKIDQACADWKRSLQISESHFDRMLEAGGILFDQRSEDLLAGQPQLRLRAATKLYPDPDSPRRRALLERALEEADADTGPLKARLLARLGRLPEATTAYTAALAKHPQQFEWRLELAEVLVHERRWRDARQELRAVLAVSPGNARATTLLREVEHQLAAGATEPGPR